MFITEILHRVHYPPALSPSDLLQSGAKVLRMSALALVFRRAHRMLPAKVSMVSATFLLTSLLFFAAAVLRHSVLGGKPIATVFLFTAMFYGVLLLVSSAHWIAEFTLCMCVSAGIDLVVSCLALAGVVEADGSAARTWFFVWELAAMYVAMVQLGISREPAVRG